MTMNLLALLVFIFAIMVILIAVYTWQLRPTNGSRFFSAVMFSMSVYVLAYSFELSSHELPLMLFWNKIEYIGIVSFPTLYLLFTSSFTTNDAWMTKKNLVLLFLLPAVFLIIKFFDNSLHLIYSTAKIEETTLIPLLHFEKGPLYYVVVAYNLTMVTLSTFLLVRKRRHASLLYIKQTNIILAVSYILYLFFLIYLSDFSLIPELKSLDLNPFTYTLWGLAISYAIFRYKLFDLVPIARETLIETLVDGVIVLDDQYRIVDVNPKTHSIFEWKDSPIGESVSKLNLQKIDISMFESLEDNHCFDSQVEKNGKKTEFEVDVSILRDNHQNKIGYLLVMHDITERKVIEKELKELSLNDELTGLSNRRGFFILSEQLFNFCIRIKKNAVLFFIDMDGLKRINDTLGHAAGDQALIDMGKVLKRSFRSSDIIARIGGDEFTILAIETTENSKRSMQNRLESQCVKFMSQQKREYQLSFSIGMAQYEWTNPISLEALLAISDQAMYENKAAKKNNLNKLL